MSKNFWIALLAGLVIAGAIVAVFYNSTKSGHLAIEGKIVRVRSVSLESNTLVAVDFRITNTSAVPLVVNGVSIIIERKGQEPETGLEVSKSDVDTLFKVTPALGVKYNDVLAAPDRLDGGKTVDRMAEASFMLPVSAVKSRDNLVVHIDDVDGAGFDISEHPDANQKDAKK